MSQSYHITINHPLETMGVLYELYDRVEETGERIWAVLDHQEQPNTIRGRNEVLVPDGADPVAYRPGEEVVRRVDGGKTFTHAGTDCFAVIEPVTGDPEETQVLDKAWKQVRDNALKETRDENKLIDQRLPALTALEREGKQFMAEQLKEAEGYTENELHINGMDIYTDTGEQVMGISYWKKDGMHMLRGCFYPDHPRKIDGEARQRLEALLAMDSHEPDTFYDAVQPAPRLTEYLQNVLELETVPAGGGESPHTDYHATEQYRNAYNAGDVFVKPENLEKSYALTAEDQDGWNGHCVLSL